MPQLQSQSTLQAHQRTAWVILTVATVLVATACSPENPCLGGITPPSRSFSTEEVCEDAALYEASAAIGYGTTEFTVFDEGVVLHVEHGPQGSCSRWIRDILGEREALVIPLDRKGAGVTALLEAAAALWTAGVELNISALLERLTLPTQVPGIRLGFQAHPEAIDIPPFPSGAAMQTMSPAPSLAPITQTPASFPVAVLPPPPAAAPG